MRPQKKYSPSFKKNLDFLEGGTLKYEYTAVEPVEIFTFPDLGAYSGADRKALEEAYAQIKAGQFKTAAEILAPIVERFPADADLAVCFSVLCVLLKQDKAGRSALEAARKDNPHHPGVLNNLACLAMRDFDYRPKTLSLLKTAQQKAPKTPEIAHNLGVLFHRQGQIGNAQECYKAALSLGKIAKTYVGLGLCALGQKNIELAESLAGDALHLAPNDHQAHFVMALAAGHKKNYDKQIEYLTFCILTAPEIPLYYSGFAQTHKMIAATPSQSLVINLPYMNAMLMFLKFEDIDHQPVFDFWLRIVQKSSLLPIFKKLILNPGLDLTEHWPELSQEMNQEIFWRASQNFMVFNLQAERAFISLRRHLLLHDNARETVYTEVLCAFSELCFYHEYIYQTSPQEEDKINILVSTLQKSPSSIPEHNARLLCLIGAYRPLAQAGLNNLALFTEEHYTLAAFQRVVKTQVKNPLKELDIKRSIKTFGTIRNEVTIKVKEQYEENPYPFWKAIYKQHAGEKQINNVTKLKKTKHTLFAGCGTGRQLPFYCINHPTTHITAIDISSASLAYAIRKVRELDIGNIDFFMGDLLDIRNLGKTFDAIICTGVLHHMEDPMEGWRALANTLKPGGEMNIGLYSESARQHIVQARDIIKNRNLYPDIYGIRKFREIVTSLPEDHPLWALVTATDFYTTSMLRDLVFHVQEHRFTIPQIYQCLEELGLEFTEFTFSNPAHVHMYENDPELSDSKDLMAWHDYEQKNPHIFREMYQFKCRKPE